MSRRFLPTNDRSIGELLAGAIDEVSPRRRHLIEDGTGLVSELEVVEGLHFDRGFLSPYFLNDASGRWRRWRTRPCFFCDKRLSSIEGPAAAAERWSRPAARCW